MDNHHRILHIRISLGSKFQLQQTTSIFFEDICPKKGFFQSKIREMSFTIRSFILELVYVPNFSLNLQFRFFGPSLSKKVFPSENRKSKFTIEFCRFEIV